MYTNVDQHSGSKEMEDQGGGSVDHLSMVGVILVRILPLSSTLSQLPRSIKVCCTVRDFNGGPSKAFTKSLFNIKTVRKEDEEVVLDLEIGEKKVNKHDYQKKKGQ